MSDFAACFGFEIMSKKNSVSSAQSPIDIDDALLLTCLLENTPDSIYFKDGAGRFLRVSDSLAKRMNLEHPKEAIGKTDHDFFADEHAREARSNEDRILRSGEPILGKEEKERWADGRESWVLTSKMPLRDAHRNIVGTFGISWDITERKRAEEALRQEHVEAELFFNSVPSILIGTNSSLEVIRWNVAAARAFGLTESAVLSKSLYNCGIKWLNPAIQEEMRSWLLTTSPRRLDNIPFERNGEKCFLGVTVNNVNLSSHEAAGLLITGADTTERNRLEMQLQQAQKMEGIGQLAAGIAHEINTPMQYIGDNVAFLKDSWEVVSELTFMVRTIQEKCAGGHIPGEIQAKLNNLMKKSDIQFLLAEIPRAIEQALDGVQRISGIVGAMKEFSHPGTSAKELRDINKAIETTIVVTRNEWKYVADVSTHLDPALQLVPCFIGELNQVLVNLIVNAAQAIQSTNTGGKKGSITIRTRKIGDFAEVSIADSGGGIAAKIRSRIFEPFFTTKEVGKGTGQGLALAHAVITQKHGGSIWFESEEGKGTTFFFRLPLHDVASAAFD
jgi:PAS domain S-box-containing protein